MGVGLLPQSAGMSHERLRIRPWFRRHRCRCREGEAGARNDWQENWRRGGGGGKGEADTVDVIMMRCCSLIGKTTTQTKVMFLSYAKYVLYVLSSICAPIEV